MHMRVDVDEMLLIQINLFSTCLTPRSLDCSIWIFSHLKLCLATAIHNFKWLKMYAICGIEVQTYNW